MNSVTLSLRYIRSRKLESALAVLGIMLGVATLAGTLSLISGYQKYYDTVSRSPEARQISVMQASRTRVTDQPAVLIGETSAPDIQFTRDHADSALEVVPTAEVFYEALFWEFRTSLAPAVQGNFTFGGPVSGGRTAVTTTVASGESERPQPPGGTQAAGGTQSNRDTQASAEAPVPGETAGPPGDMLPPEFASSQTVDATLEKPTVETISGAMVSGGFFAAYSLTPLYGDIFSDAADNTGSPTVVLGYDLAKGLYESVTETSALIGKKLILNNTAYTIGGVLERDEWSTSGRAISFNEMAFVPSSSMRFGGMGRSAFRVLSFAVREGSNPAQTALQLENYFSSVFGEGSVVASANIESYQKELTKRQRILTLMAILASASAITAAINLFNLMTSRVLRRKRPIAIMRAIGAWNRKVFAQIMVEASLIGSCGALLGIALSPLVIRVLSSLLNGDSKGVVSIQADIGVLCIVGTVAVAISLIFAALPAKNGASLVITDALRSE